MTKLAAILLLMNFVLISLKAASPEGVTERRFSLGEDYKDEDEESHKIGRSKRKLKEITTLHESSLSASSTTEEHENTDEINYPALKRREIKYDDMIYNKLKIAIEGVKSRNVIEYLTDREINFYDKLIRRSLNLPLKRDPDEMELWEMPCTLILNLEFHTESFFYILTNRINFSEESLLEYFMFIYNKWVDKYSNESIELHLVKICELAIKASFPII